MSKKKNTLKDLDEFLRQQAATLVTPEKLVDKQEEKPQTPTLQETPALGELNNIESIINAIRSLSAERDFTIKLADIILGSVTSITKPGPEEKMLINTALYLKHGDNWKEAIRQYWKNFDR